LRKIPRAKRDEYFSGDYFQNKIFNQQKMGNYPKPYNNPIFVVTRQEQQPKNELNIESINFPGVEGPAKDFTGRIEQ
jgi:hypothetical protein